MRADNLLMKIQEVFFELGFENKVIGDKKDQYLCYNNCYCKITYLKKIEAFVIESADNMQDAINGVLEDGDLYYLDAQEEDILYQIKEDIKRYYVE